VLGEQVATSGNQALAKAKVAKQDEFYTQLGDISNELKHYKSHLQGKTILCNCDDPYESNFFKYFALNFNAIGLKKLIATSYHKSPIAGGQLPLFEIEGLKPDGKEPYAIEINEVPDQNGDGATDLSDVEYLLKHDANTAQPLNGNGIYNGGDFRSDECLEYLKQADIVVTNPPFSLFREYVAQLVEHGKKFLIIGNMNAVTYKDIFPLIKDNRLWYGQSIRSGDREFGVPADYPLEAAGTRVDEDGNKFIRVKGVRWFTNLDYLERHEQLPLYKTYSQEKYPTYVNYDAIDVEKATEIPSDYFGAMGVPITLLDRYSPEQFEILGNGDDMDMLRELGVRQLGREFIDGYRAEGGTGHYSPGMRMLGLTVPKHRVAYKRILIRRKP
jgi:hypothetical protein